MCNAYKSFVVIESKDKLKRSTAESHIDSILVKGALILFDLFSVIRYKSDQDSYRSKKPYIW